MARTTQNIILRQLSGQVGKQLVIKHYGKKAVITAYPDMSKVKPSGLQKTKRKAFAKAVAYAKAIIKDPVKKAQYAKKVKKGQFVFNYAIREYFETIKNS